MDAAGLRVVQADTGIGFGGDPLPADLHGEGDALHADPVQGRSAVVVWRAISGSVKAFMENSKKGRQGLEMA